MGPRYRDDGGQEHAKHFGRDSRQIGSILPSAIQAWVKLDTYSPVAGFRRSDA